MGIFDQAIDKIKQSATQLAQAFGAPKSSKTDADDLYETLWKVNGADWYKVFAYAFEIRNVDSNGVMSDIPDYIYTLPIPPQMLAINQIPASVATATIGGVVEETSNTVFWSIQLSGSLGVAVSRGAVDDLNQGPTYRGRMANQFRDVISTTGLLSGFSAALGGIVNKVGGVVDGIKDASDPAGYVGAINNALLPPTTFSQSAVSAETNGYTEAQELSKFLYFYGMLKERNSDGWALCFRNDKDGQLWRCIVKSGPGLQKSAGSPLSYRYSIQLTGWDVSPTMANPKAGFDRFGPNGDLRSVNTVGLESLKLMKAIYNTSTGQGKQNAGLLLKPGSSLL